MRASVRSAWPAFCTRWEGRLATIYLDTKGKATTGTGNLIDSVAAAQALPWLTKDNKPATPAQIEAEWKQIKARTSLAPLGGYAFVKYATLHLDTATLDRLLSEVTATFWARMAKTLTAIESFPADAQLALLDEAWQNGPAFLDPGTAWTGTRAAVLAQDWTAAASHVPGTGARADARKRLFRNAAAVANIGLDPDVLWNEKTPTAPKEGTVAHSSKWGIDYVWFRGGNVPLVVRDILLAIPSPVQLSQGGLSGSVSASANTHLGLGAYDISVKGWSKDAITKLCSELISCGECAFPRGPRWGSPSFAEHVHVCSNNAYNSLHPDAQAQVRDFKHSPRLNGLVGHGTYIGPKTPLGKWSDSPWNPVNIAKKENELPTTAEVAKALASDKGFLEAVANAVINADVIPNTFTSNPDNVNVSTKTALTTLGKRTADIASIKTAVDALLSRFPGDTPPPAA